MAGWDMRDVVAEMQRRDDFSIDDDDSDDFWWSTTGRIVRWCIFGGFVVLAMLFLILGYLHAKRRIRKGLAPLWYHKFLLTSQERAQFNPSYQQPLPEYSVHRPDQYGMYAYPPPVYDPNAPAPPSYQPPAYQPPEDATKIDPSQSRPEPRNTQAAVVELSPSRPPLAAPLNPVHTSSSSTSNNPYQQ